MHANHKRTLTLSILLVLALVSLGLFLAWDLPKAWQWALERRAYIAGGLIVVATSIGLSTVLFQTITANRILTPSLMGFGRGKRVGYSRWKLASWLALPSCCMH